MQLMQETFQLVLLSLYQVLSSTMSYWLVQLEWFFLKHKAEMRSFTPHMIMKTNMDHEDEYGSRRRI